MAHGILALVASSAISADPPSKGIKSVKAAVEPAEAKPGQTVTVKLKG